MAVSWDAELNESSTEDERHLLLQQRKGLEVRHAELCTEGQRLADSADANALRAHITRLHQFVVAMLAFCPR